jgi:hypothetical protein
MNTKIVNAAAEDKDLEEASKFSSDTIDEAKYLRKRFHQPAAVDVQPMEVDAGAAEVVIQPASRVLPRKRTFEEAAAANPNSNLAIEPPPKKGPGRPPKVTPFQGHVVQLNRYPLINEKTGRKSFVEGSHSSFLLFAAQFVVFPLRDSTALEGARLYGDFVDLSRVGSHWHHAPYSLVCRHG